MSPRRLSSALCLLAPAARASQVLVLGGKQCVDSSSLPCWRPRLCQQSPRRPKRPAKSVWPNKSEATSNKVASCTTTASASSITMAPPTWLAPLPSEQRDTAVRLAQQVEGVTHVVCKLELKTKANAHGPEPESNGSDDRPQLSERAEPSFVSKAPKTTARSVMQAYRAVRWNRKAMRFQQNQMPQLPAAWPAGMTLRKLAAAICRCQRDGWPA